MKNHVCRRRSQSSRKKKRSLSWSLKPTDPSAKSKNRTQTRTPPVTSERWAESRSSLWIPIFPDLPENQRVTPSLVNPSLKSPSHLQLQPPPLPAYLWIQSLFILLSSSPLHLWPLLLPAWSSAILHLQWIPALRLHPKLSISPGLIAPASLRITLSRVASLIAEAAAVETSQITLSTHQPSSHFNFSSAERKSVYDFQSVLTTTYKHICFYLCILFTFIHGKYECIMRIQKHKLKVMCITST